MPEIQGSAALVHGVLEDGTMMNSINVAFDQSHDSDVDTILTLPSETSAIAIAASCRDTALAFMEDSKHWGKAELAMWLMGPYGQITQHTAFAERTVQSGMYPKAQVPLLRDIDARMVERVIQSARDEVTQRLARSIDSDGEEGFAFEMLALGFVVRCEDARHVEGFIPSASARRLADRVLSLFAADYLARPGDYAHALSVCRTCEAVDFDPISRARGTCSRHGSGVWMPRASHAPSLGPEGA